MRLSFNQTTSEGVRDDNGFGYAAKMCKDSLRELGHEVNWRDPTADVEINFIQPHHWHWTGPYRIAYLPWESTEFRPGWIDSLNECDEVWTPSPVIAQWMVDAGVKKTPHIYQHGVESVWAPKERILLPGERWKILHHGAEALRKGGNNSIKAFMNTLWDEDATLVMKMLLQQWNVHDTEHIKIYKKKLSLEDLVDVYNECHAMIYPSYGEGFGLAPLQAMATGIPVLISKGWAPYEYLLPEELLVESQLIPSPWPDHHPGKVLEPNQEELEFKLLELYKNQESWSKFALDLSEKVHKDYNWIDLTREAFAHLN
jgi:glycosyltransferase involved in cell wall biosynthesis